MPRKSRSAREVLNELFIKATRLENGCLISHLRPNAKGYIPVQIGGRNGDKWRANRLVQILCNGPIPEGMGALHTCDNRACIEPTHLYAGTPKDNSNDMVARNRVARLGQPPTKDFILEETVQLRKQGFTHKQIAEAQNLSSVTSVTYRLRRAKDAGIE